MLKAEEICLSEDVDLESTALPAGVVGLRPGHTVALSGQEAADKIFLIDGMQKGTELEELDVVPTAYTLNALVPATSWRKPDESELELLTSPSEAPASIEILSLSPELVKALQEAWKDCVKEGVQPEIEDLPGDVAMHLELELDRVVPWDVEMIDAYIDPPSYSSTMGISSEYIGLHMDGNRLNNESYAPRAIFNLSEQPRFIVFSNMNLKDIAEEVDEHELDVMAVMALPEPYQAALDHNGITLEDYVEIREKVMEHIGDYPLVALKLDPGEAWYSDSFHVIIHDGCAPMGGDLKLDLRGFEIHME